MEIRNSQATGDSPLPWHMPWKISRGSPPIHVIDFPHPVLRKNYVNWMVRNMEAMAPVCTPRHKKAMAIIVWYILP